MTIKINKPSAVVRMYPAKRRQAGSLILLFPSEAVNTDHFMCQAYQAVGQHGAADYGHVILKTEPAPADIAAIALATYCEMCDLPQDYYVLRARATRYDMDTRLATIKQWHAMNLQPKENTNNG